MKATIQDKKIELIQWLSTLEDSTTIEKLLDIRDADKSDWWSSTSEAERNSIQKGINDIKENNLKSQVEAKSIYEKWL